LQAILRAFNIQHSTLDKNLSRRNDGHSMTQTLLKGMTIDGFAQNTVFYIWYLVEHYQVHLLDLLLQLVLQPSVEERRARD
jgi:hypothetical protein